MKDIVIASIVVAFIGVAMICVALWVVSERTNTIARIAIEHTDFDNYSFIQPDGQTFRPCDGFVD